MNRVRKLVELRLGGVSADIGMSTRAGDAQLDHAIGVWKRLVNLPADELFSVLLLLVLDPMRRGHDSIVSLCPCCGVPGTTWHPKARVNGAVH